MTFEEMMESIRVRLGVPPSDNFYTDQYLASLLNEALQVVSLENDWPWLQVAGSFQTVPGQATYTPPTNWIRTKGLLINEFNPMIWQPLASIREIGTDVSGVPQFFTIFAEQILLSPKPAAIYTVQHDYIRTESAISDPSESPLMPGQFHWVVVTYAVYLAALRGDNATMATEAKASYAAWLTRMRDHRRRSAGPLTVRVRPGSNL